MQNYKIERNNKFLAGWLSGNGEQLYIKRWFDDKIKKECWGVTEYSKEGYLFNTPQDCIKFYISFHAFPANALESIGRGTLIIIDSLGQFNLAILQS